MQDQKLFDDDQVTDPLIYRYQFLNCVNKEIIIKKQSSYKSVTVWPYLDDLEQGILGLSDSVRY